MRRKLALAGLALGSLLAGWAIWGRIEAGRRWAALEREAREHVAPTSAAYRPTFHPDAQLGDAADDYLRAFDAFQNRSAAGPILDGIRKGARRTSCRPIELPFRGKAAPVLADLGDFVLGEARKLEGDAAVDLILDAALFARDISASTWVGNEMNGIVFLESVCEELRSMLLTEAQAARAAKALAAVDAGFPAEGRSALNTLIALAAKRADGTDWKEIFESVKMETRGSLAPGFRYKFSERLMEAEAFERRLDLARRATRAESWEEARRLDTKVNALPLENGWASLLPRDLVLERRRARTRVRLLRMAFVWQATGRLQDLADPFGAYAEQEKLLKDGRRPHALVPVLLIRKDGKFWSAGPDGQGLQLELGP